MKQFFKNLIKEPLFWFCLILISVSVSTENWERVNFGAGMIVMIIIVAFSDSMEG